MQMAAKFLHSKVARRIVLLFFSCALLPVTILAVVSYRQVSSQLREQSQKHLLRRSKEEGMAIYARLRTLEAELQMLALVKDRNRSGNLGPAVRETFNSAAEFLSNGTRRTYWGNPVTFPHFTFEQQQHLLAGKTLLQTQNCDSGEGACVLMARMVSPGKPKSGILVGELNLNYLFAAEESADLLICVLSGARSLLFCSDDRMQSQSTSFPLFDRSSGIFDWKWEDMWYETAYWKLLVKPAYLPAYLEESWTIVLGQERASAMAPMQHFRRSFPLVVVLSLWIVLLFSMIQIRRTLEPMARLQEGTRRIAARNFQDRVQVRSGDEFEDLAGSFNSMAEQVGQQFQVLQTINEIDEAIFASLEREAIIDGVLVRMPRLLTADCFAALVFDEMRLSGWVRFTGETTGSVHIPTTELGTIEWQQLQQSPVTFSVGGQDKIPEYLRVLYNLGMRSFLVLPIRVSETVQAVLVCAQRAAGVVPDAAALQARQVADQLAVAFSHVHLLKALEELHWGTLTALARAIDAKSAWTAGHSERVTELAVGMGRQMGLSAEELRIMQMGGLLHDIGNIGTPPHILDKPGALTPDEMRIMQDHVRIGVRILEPISGFRKALPIVSQHHEWFDGRGYPEGLAGENISLYARIFAVADCYDALTSDRPYRTGLPRQKALAMLRAESGQHFDPRVIDTFMRLLAERNEAPEVPAPAVLVT
jgi:putative nucleotidyltransferase with HDIG domain